jgi:hypothetical protein
VRANGRVRGSKLPPSPSTTTTTTTTHTSWFNSTSLSLSADSYQLTLPASRTKKTNSHSAFSKSDTMRASFYKASFVVAGAEAPKPTAGDFLRLEVQLKAIFFAAELPAKPSEEVIGIGFALQGSKPVAPAKPAQSVLGSSKNAVKAALPSQAFTPVTPSVSFASLISPGAAPARPVLCAASTSAAAPTVIKPFSDAPCASINNGQGWTLVSRAAKANKVSANQSMPYLHDSKQLMRP